MQEMGIQFGDNTSERATAILNRVKTLESIGYTFEGAEASVRLMILHASEDYCPPFRVLDYSAQVFDNNMDFVSRVLWQEEDDTNGNGFRKGPTARATIKVRTMNEDEVRRKPIIFLSRVLTKHKLLWIYLHIPLILSIYDDIFGQHNSFIDRLEVSDGNGPIDALASALKRSLAPTYDVISNIELVDYKVRILDPEHATGAATRVMVEFRDQAEGKTWTTVSVDTNVISASLNALIDGFEYALLTKQEMEMCMMWEDKFQ